MCNKPPRPPRTSRQVNVTGAERHRMDAGREAALRPYDQLMCKHYTTREIQTFYDAWRPAKNKAFCETCGRWVKIVPKPKPVELTDEIPF